MKETYTLTLAELTRARFRKHCSEATAADGRSWAFLRQLKTPPRPALAPLIHHGKPIASAVRQAEIFARQYADVSKRHPDDTKTKPIKSLGTKHRVPMVTRAEVHAAIVSLKNGKAAGLDGIHGEFIKNLPPKGFKYLLMAVRQSLRFGFVPKTWRKGEIVPLLKPGKPPTDSTSFRPVTLTSVLSKVTERVVLRRICSVR